MKTSNKANDTFCHICKKPTEEEHGADNLPEGWGQEFCKQYPEDPEKNRLLCPDCNQEVSMQSGTVRFVS